MLALAINPTKYGNEVALNSKGAPGQGTNDTRLRSARHARTPAPGSSHQHRETFSVLSARNEAKAADGLLFGE